MPANVFTPPAGFEEPSFDICVDEGFEAYNTACNKHTEELAEWCRNEFSKLGKKPNDLIGKIIRFPVADGLAQYMVCSTKPLDLIHLNYVDGYMVNDIMLRGLRVTDVREMVEREQRMSELFGRK